jgi:hypothetical protein
MEYAGTQLSWPQREARQTVNDRDAEAEAEANKQRRKVQNWRNQRARRKYAPRYYNWFYTQKPPQDYGSRAETWEMFMSHAHSRSGAGALTSPTIFPPKKFR